MQKRWTLILFGIGLLFILLIQVSIPCLAQTHIGTERTPPKRSAYKTAIWPVTFALKLPARVLYTNLKI